MADETPPTPEPDEKPEPKAQDKPDDFKSDESKQRVLADLAKERDERQKLAARLKEYEDAKSEAEKTTERLTTAEKRAEKAEGELLRLTVGLEKGLTPAQARRLVGATKDELEADADDLLATFGGDKKAPPQRKPNERLRGGSDPDDPPGETDPRKLAAAIRARRGH